MALHASPSGKKRLYASVIPFTSPEFDGILEKTPITTDRRDVLSTEDGYGNHPFSPGCRPGDIVEYVPDEESICDS